MKNMNKINRQWFKMKYDRITRSGKSTRKVRNNLASFLYRVGIYKHNKRLTLAEYDYVTNKIKELYG